MTVQLMLDYLKRRVKDEPIAARIVGAAILSWLVALTGLPAPVVGAVATLLVGGAARSARDLVTPSHKVIVTEATTRRQSAVTRVRSGKRDAAR